MSEPTTKSDPATAVSESKASAKALKLKRFKGVFDVIRKELVDHFASQGMPQEAVDWYQRVSAFSLKIDIFC